jgi:hypothetical protein
VDLKSRHAAPLKNDSITSLLYFLGDFIDKVKKPIHFRIGFEN